MSNNKVSIRQLLRSLKQDLTASTRMKVIFEISRSAFYIAKLL